MTESMIIQLGKEAFTVTLLSAMPLLGISLIIGVAVSILQAATQIQELTLSFVPKVLAVGVAGMFFGPWMMDNLIVYTTNLLSSLPDYAH